MIMMKADSVLKASAQRCLKVIHSVRTTVPVITMVVETIAPVRDKADTSLVRVVISHVKDRKAAISPVRDKVDTSLAKEVINPVRVVISLAKVRKAAISPVRVDTSSARVVTSLVRDRVAISSARVVTRNHMATSHTTTIHTRKVRASIQQTTIRMLSTA